MTQVDGVTANEIRSQSLQDFTVHGRAHQHEMAELESDSRFFTNLLKASAIDNHREMGAVEAKSTETILGSPPIRQQG